MVIIKINSVMKLAAMKWLGFFFFFVSVAVCMAENVIIELEKENENPIIGILSQEISVTLKGAYPGKYQSFIAASYVKFVEGGGARVVPIWIGRDEAYYEDILSKVNGVLLPGGACWFNQSNGYADAGEYIYKVAKKLNDDGEYFPLWGICLGFELLTYLSANRKDHRMDCSSSRQALNLEFKPDFRNSKLFNNTPDEVITILKNKYVTANFHRFCVSEKNLTLIDIEKEWKVLSVNDDVNGLNFISSLESNRYPFYGVQFHPEKNLYEWTSNRNISHTGEAILANGHFANFFVNEARKSHHRFANESEEDLALIYNYEITYTSIKKIAYEQCYMFTSDQNQGNNLSP